MNDKRDANEAELVSFWKRCGCIWIPQDRRAGFDGLLVAWSGIYIVEVKNPAGKNRLTEAEKRCKAEIESTGQAYNIIRTVEEAARLIGR